MKTELDDIRARLEGRKGELVSLSAASTGARKPIELDQQSVGRLSRMDSLQVQAMDQATEARRALDLKRIEAALTRLSDGEYGYCVTCGNEIPVARLEVDPAAAQCTSCAK